MKKVLTGNQSEREKKYSVVSGGFEVISVGEVSR